ncbi:MAG: hypothetical protein AAF282_19520 [Cyanobacteria bacterium P01_A01_bin.15]
MGAWPRGLIGRRWILSGVGSKDKKLGAIAAHKNRIDGPIVPSPGSAMPLVIFSDWVPNYTEYS